MIDELTRVRLRLLHDEEDGLNREIGAIDIEMAKLKRRKIKLAKQVSQNMKLRNMLIFPERFPKVESERK